jgi:hypothetical protein
MTLEELQAHLKSGYMLPYGGRRQCDKIECADGFALSVQASNFHYCTPRDYEGPYTHVEIGFPSEVETELMPYCEDINDPTGTVYANVPIELVLSLINKHNRNV